MYFALDSCIDKMIQCFSMSSNMPFRNLHVLLSILYFMYFQLGFDTIFKNF